MTTASNFISTFSAVALLIGSRLGKARRVAIVLLQSLNADVFGSGSDELLAAVDIIGCARKGGIDHKMYGQCGDICWLDNPPDGKFSSQLATVVFELIANNDADNCVSTNPAAIRFTRTGASSSARLAVRVGSAAVNVDKIPRPMAGRRPPVPPMNIKVPPGFTLSAGFRATSMMSEKCSSSVRRA